MKRWTTMTALVMAILVSAVPATAQEDGWDRMMERIEAAVERAMAGAEHATERALLALENVDWDEAFSGLDAQDRGPAVQEEFRWTGRVAEGGILEIKGVNGPISAEPASGDEIEVVAMKEGRRNDPAEVRIEVLEHSGGVTLCAVYPTPRGKEANECGIGDEGRNSVRRNDVRVDWEVRVPRGVRLRGRTVNGGVEARDLEADVDVTTVNGDVDISTSGFAAARTVNGSIHARMGGDPTGDLAFETVNGTIELDMDEGVDADLDASWVNGSLRTDIPFRVQGRMGRRSAEGTLGEGGPLLRLRTVNGWIRIY